MSNAVYAHLVYGFVVMNDEGDAPAENEPPQWLAAGDGDIPKIITRIENIIPPVEKYGEGKNPEVREKYETYWRAIRDATNRSGVRIIDHCSSQCHMWILGVAESVHSEWRSEVARLGQKIEARPEWRDVLKTFCDRAGIPFTEPEWLLAPFSE